jgi:chaperone required for assembly of F1-ATPase
MTRKLLRCGKNRAILRLWGLQLANRGSFAASFCRYRAALKTGLDMRDIFEELFANQPLDPMEAARRGMRPNARRRFYAAASTRPEEGGYAVLLDGRIVRTPARHALAAPSEALAEAIAAEWEGQGEMIDPAKMPLTRLANTIIDGVTKSIDAVTAEIEKYLATDLLFYRAEGPDRLVARQRELWDAILAWARITLGARFELVEGVIHIAQPEQSLRTAARAIPRDPWRLGAVHAVTTLTGSALIALALAQGAIDVDAAWAAAHVDEDWNMELWGRDEIALERRAFRFAEMQAAATVVRLA